MSQSLSTPTVLQTFQEQISALQSIEHLGRDSTLKRLHVFYQAGTKHHNWMCQIDSLTTGKYHLALADKNNTVHLKNKQGSSTNK